MGDEYVDFRSTRRHRPPSFLDEKLDGDGVDERDVNFDDDGPLTPVVLSDDADNSRERQRGRGGGRGLLDKTESARVLEEAEFPTLSPVSNKHRSVSVTSFGVVSPLGEAKDDHHLDDDRRRYSYDTSRDPPPMPQSVPILQISLDGGAETPTIAEGGCDDEDDIVAGEEWDLSRSKIKGRGGAFLHGGGGGGGSPSSRSSGGRASSPPMEAFPPSLDDSGRSSAGGGGTETEVERTEAAARALLVRRDADAVRDRDLKDQDVHDIHYRDDASSGEEWDDGEEVDIADVYGQRSRRRRIHRLSSRDGQKKAGRRALPGARMLRSLVPTFAPKRGGGSSSQRRGRMRDVEADWNDNDYHDDYYDDDDSVDGSQRAGQSRQWGGQNGGRVMHGSMPPPEPRGDDDKGMNRCLGSLEHCRRSAADRARRHCVWICILISALCIFFIVDLYEGLEEAYSSEYWDSEDTDAGHGEIGGDGDGGGSDRPRPDPAQARVNAIAERIVRSNVSPSSSLHAPPEGIKHVRPTPQYLALSWLASSDPAKLDPEDEFLLQRYALAVLWYSTHEDDISSVVKNGGFVHGTDGGAVHDLTKLRDHLKYATPWRKSDGWMSGKGVCDWHGVTCDGDGDGDALPLSPSSRSLILGQHGDEDSGSGHFLREKDDERQRERNKDFEEAYYLGSGSGSPDATEPTRDDLGKSVPSMDETTPPSTEETTHKDRNDGPVTHLILEDNRLSGDLPPELFAALSESLLVLDLAENDLRGTLPEKELAKSSQLTRLDLAGNDLDGTIPPSVRDLGSLVELNLRDNDLRGPVPSSELARLGPTLTSLSLSGNGLTGMLSSDLGALTELTTFDVRSNRLEGSIPENLRRLHKLKTLDLGNNTLTGRVPPELWQLNLLEELILDGNDLTGDLPASFEELSFLQRLDLGENSLEGTLPVEWSRLANLRTLRLDGNGGLSGTVPKQWGLDLNRLVELDLSRNALVGSVPTELGSMASLEVLRLAHNRLTGTVPSELARTGKLVRINLEGNNGLGGTVPESLCQLKLQVGKLLSLTVVACDGDGGGEDQHEKGVDGGQIKGEEVICDCCTGCDD